MMFKKTKKIKIEYIYVLKIEENKQMPRVFLNVCVYVK